MKKRSLTPLKLNKKIIANPKVSMIVKGGGTHYNSICECPLPDEPEEPNTENPGPCIDNSGLRLCQSNVINC